MTIVMHDLYDLHGNNIITLRYDIWLLTLLYGLEHLMYMIHGSVYDILVGSYYEGSWVPSVLLINTWPFVCFLGIECMVDKL